MIATLITALYLLGLLNAASTAMSLYIFGALLIIAEASMLSTFGVLALNGVIALAVGYMVDHSTDHIFGLNIDWSFFFGIAFAEFLIIAACVFVVLYMRKHKVTTGLESMIGEPAQVIEWSGGKGRVQIHGETWAATSDDPVKAGHIVYIADIKHLTLRVTKQKTPQEG